MAVFVVDQHHQPLMPCSEKRARHLLSRKRAVVHRLMPFTLRLKDRRRETAQVQAVALKLDPGSKTTGIALVRIEKTQQGELHHAVHLADLAHRGQQVRKGMLQRASYRRRRRSANLRYRPARFENRVRPSKWLPPALGSRLGNVLTWVQRYRKWIPISRLEVESVKFDPARLKNPELTGVAYQRGELFGWEIRAYLLEKFQRRCVYCRCADTAFEIDHVVPRSRGGSDAVSNLVLSCHTCNTAKGNRTGAEFGHPEVEAKARLPLGDAAAMNATRYALVDRLEELGLPVLTWSGGRTRWNRDRLGIQKAHCLDALCVGELVGVRLPALRRLQIMAKGRGSHQRTNVDATGFPAGYLTRQKRIRSFSTGDLVRAEVPGHLKTAGVHVGRVAVRMSGFFRIGKTDGINAKYCHLLQRTDGYEYA
jgi:5-methylcytosine-specific restriction endonuclease McrA